MAAMFLILLGDVMDPGEGWSCLEARGRGSGLVTGAATVLTLVSENFLGPKMLALSLTLTLSDSGLVSLLSDLTRFFSFFSRSELAGSEIANSSGLDWGLLKFSVLEDFFWTDATATSVL